MSAGISYVMSAPLERQGQGCRREQKSTAVQLSAQPPLKVLVCNIITEEGQLQGRGRWYMENLIKG